MRRGLAIVFVLGFALAGAGSGPAPSAARTAASSVQLRSPWVRPVAGGVVRPFVAPAHPYGPGHRGADLAAAPDTPVRAAGPGVVVFAGTVADGLHVVVLHANGLRTGYSFLATSVVHPGDALAGGQVLGTTGGTGGTDDPGHDGAALHFSLRRGETYLDPMRLFAPVDLGAVVHLAPIDGP